MNPVPAIFRLVFMLDQYPAALEMAHHILFAIVACVMVCAGLWAIVRVCRLFDNLEQADERNEIRFITRMN